MSRQYLQRSRGAQYEVGSQVWLHNPRRKRGLAPKLQSPWEGPYTVLAALTDVTYRLRGGPRDRVVVVHVDRMCPYHSGGHFTWEENEGAGEDRDLVGDPFPREDSDSLPGEDVNPPTVWQPGEETRESVEEEIPASAISDSDTLGDVPRAPAAAFGPNSPPSCLEARLCV